jgi:Ca2+-binding RTX toxin-like protein
MGLMRIGPIAILLLLLGGATAAIATPGIAAPGPGCGNPVTVGHTILGTPCDDTIVVPPRIEAVHGGAGDDTIVAAPIGASAPCPAGCHLGVGSQTFDGGPGDDVVFGERGNDTLNGGEGNDRLYGGIGDDQLHGGPGDDLLSGGFGFDVIDGEAGNDYVRGDGTVDEITDSGGGFDTLSYATGVTPGFTRSPGTYPGFPSASGERGVYVDLGTGLGDNGVAPNGGGVDEIKGGFEKVIGTPFSDYIAGTGAAETIDGGGGADVLIGGGGGDTINGGADGDRCEGFATATSCENVGSGVTTRNQTAVSIGIAAPEETSRPELYLTGSSQDDEVTATYSAGPPTAVEFDLGPGSDGSFDESAAGGGGCDVVEPDEAVCQLAAPPDSVVLAGMAGDDTLRAVGFPDSTLVVALGGEGNDSLLGGDGNEDVLVDGPGNDRSEALGGDDALLNNGGVDTLSGGSGNDLLLSNTICGGDLLDGGADRDNSSWAKFTEPVAASLDAGVAGRPVNGAPTCSSGSLDRLQGIEDLEGTGQGDFLYGDAGPNQLLGRPGADTYFALGGEDSILANSGDADLVIDCGEGNDSALVDLPQYGDPAPIECESVTASPPNSFEPPLLPAAPPSPLPVAPPRRKPDRTPPRTRILHRPPKLLLVHGRRPRRVSFAFAASEPGASFRCRLDRAPFAPCRSPRAYAVRPGRHTVRIFAIDAAGNRDRTPARLGFRVRHR